PKFHLVPAAKGNQQQCERRRAPHWTRAANAVCVFPAVELKRAMPRTDTGLPTTPVSLSRSVWTHARKPTVAFACGAISCENVWRTRFIEYAPDSPMVSTSI